ncbi:GNAT family N-acetyltransferase [Photobacterium sp. 53610]|uniref:GNAT family N-acetyltransferase n=1 Tax=Photobacterium sp. 53610 TaxID=3102789 RepID=UPI002ED7EE4B
MEIVQAAMRHEQMYVPYVKACAESGIKHYQSAADAPEAYFRNWVDYAEGRNLPEGWVPVTTYFCIRDGEILGTIRVRTGTNERVENILGHIGYETQPNARRQGVASQMLQWVCRHVIKAPVRITCDAENIFSRQVIERNGGRLLKHYFNEETQTNFLCFELSPLVG